LLVIARKLGSEGPVLADFVAKVS
jgi:hypothetical protein